MKRVIKADSEFSYDELVDKLYDGLNDNFEENIVARYANYVDDDYSHWDRTDQHTAWLTLMRARRKYVEALAAVIKYVDVTDMTNYGGD